MFFFCYVKEINEIGKCVIVIGEAASYSAATIVRLATKLDLAV
jgi:hypothetical protein